MYENDKNERVKLQWRLLEEGKRVGGERVGGNGSERRVRREVQEEKEERG